MLGKSLREFLHYFAITSDDERIIQGFAVDSRAVKPGFVFFALKGEKVDGHDFLLEAFHKGAIAAVVCHTFTGKFSGHTLIRVEDVLNTLQELAKVILQRGSKRILAITGSMGKTTTKEFCAQLLSPRYKVFKTPGNANSQIGLPLSILNGSASEYDLLVLEMGMMGYGQIRRLVEIAPPEIAVITKIAPAHLEFFAKGLEGIAEAKSEILSHPHTRHAVLNAQAYAYAPVRTTGHCHKEVYTVDKSTYSSAGHWLEQDAARVRICTATERSPWIELPFDVPHLMENFVAAAVVARYFGLSWEQIKDHSQKLELFEKRYEKIEREGVTFINDSYNANPETMKAAIAHLPKPKEGGRIILALGHMVELGDVCQTMHLEVGEYASQYADALLCLGEKCLPMKEGFAKSGKPVFHFSDIQEMQKSLRSQAQRGDVVLVKASNSVRLWRLFDAEIS